MPAPSDTVPRRSVIAVIGTLFIGVAGCSEPRSSVSTETSIHLSDGDRRQTMVDGETDTLDPDQYVWWEFSIDDPLDVSYDVRVTEGESVNCYVLTVDQYDVFEDEESGFEAIEGSIATETGETERTVGLDPGDYRLVVANADILPENA